jgi:hypothetical protein
MAETLTQEQERYIYGRFISTLAPILVERHIEQAEVCLLVPIPPEIAELDERGGLRMILCVGLRVAVEVRGVEPARLRARHADERRRPRTLPYVPRACGAIPVGRPDLHRLENSDPHHRLA